MRAHIMVTLYRKSHTGAVHEWRIRAEENDDKTARVITVFGQDTMQTAVKNIYEGKNLGRSNSTTPYEQAISEAQSKWNKQKLDGYTEDPDTAPMHVLPMLAQKYQDRIGKVPFPVKVQPKLNGFRCIAARQGNTISLASRKGKPCPGLEHIRQDLLSVMNDGEVWDGELFRMGYPFEKIASWAKRVQPEQKILQYHVFDTVDTTKPFFTRWQSANNRIVDASLLNVFSVPTWTAESHVMVESFQLTFIEEGHEGLMLRVGDCTYKLDYRSPQLLKFKNFIDEEFTVLSIHTGTGKFEGLAIFTMENPQGDNFECVMRGTFEERREQLDNADKYIGKPMTVRFQNWSSYKVPIFPVGIAIRED